MPRDFRLLISARDPGAANNLGPVALLAQATAGVHLDLVASAPADNILRAQGLLPVSVAHQPERLPDTAKTLIDRLRPDAILVGLSGPEPGIDEALLAAAGSIRTWALQDFWGDLNNGFGAYADTYLVRDQTAARLTHQRAGVSTEVTGSPAQQQIPASLQQRLLARRLRTRHGLHSSAPLLVLASQPLWRQPGYRETLRDLLHSLPQGKLLVRMHPRESEHDRRRMRHLLRQHCRIRWAFSDEPFDALLAAADLLLSAFSNSGLDKALYNHAAPRHAGTPVFLLHQPRLRSLYRDWTGLADHPLNASGASFGISAKGQLRSGLRRALSRPARARGAQASHTLVGPQDAAAVVLRQVMSENRSNTALT